MKSLDVLCFLLVYDKWLLKFIFFIYILKLWRENKKWIKNPQINEYSLSLSHLQGFSFTITCMPNVILAFLATYTSHP